MGTTLSAALTAPAKTRRTSTPTEKTCRALAKRFGTGELTLVPGTDGTVYVTDLYTVVMFSAGSDVTAAVADLMTSSYPEPSAPGFTCHSPNAQGFTSVRVYVRRSGDAFTVLGTGRATAAGVAKVFGTAGTAAHMLTEWTVDGDVITGTDVGCEVSVRFTASVLNAATGGEYAAVFVSDDRHPAAVLNADGEMFAAVMPLPA